MTEGGQRPGKEGDYQGLLLDLVSCYIINYSLCTLLYVVVYFTVKKFVKKIQRPAINSKPLFRFLVDKSTILHPFPSFNLVSVGKRNP